MNDSFLIIDLYLSVVHSNHTPFIVWRTLYDVHYRPNALCHVYTYTLRYSKLLYILYSVHSTFSLIIIHLYN